MKVVTAPDKPDYDRFPSLFLAGGITDCPDWQADIIERLKDTSLTIFNPRRPSMPREKEAIREQVRWEFCYLRVVDIISFWFPKETMCPITLYELGQWLGRRELWGKPETSVNMPKLVPQILIGVHPDYARKFDIEEQLACVENDCHPDYRVKIVDSLSALADQIIDRVKTLEENKGVFKVFRREVSL